MDEDLLAFTRRLIALRTQHPVFRRRRYLAGAGASEPRWFTPAGTPMTAAGWADPSALSPGSLTPVIASPSAPGR